MSGSNALMAPPGNPLMANANAPPTSAPPSVPAQDVTPDQFHHLVSGSMRGRTQDQMVQRREAAGPELDMLSRVMRDPDPKPDEVKDYMLTLMKAGQIPAQDAATILQSMPDEPDALRTWAHTMFGLVMHVGTHAHAAFPREQFPAATQAPPGDGENDA